MAVMWLVTVVDLFCLLMSSRGKTVDYCYYDVHILISLLGVSILVLHLVRI